MSAQPILKLQGTKVCVFCQACGAEIEDNGHIWIDQSDVSRVEEAWDAKRNKTTWSPAELARMPSQVGWQAHHFSCDPKPDAYAYEILAERINTAAKLVHWTAHLMGKSWIEATDWANVLRSASDVNT